MEDHPQEQIVWGGELFAAVFGAGEDFMLVFPDDTVDEAVIAAKGFSYVGLLAFVNGQAVARCEPGNPGAVYTMCFAGLEFARHVADKIKREQKSDSGDFLRRLWDLPDTRN